MGYKFKLEDVNIVAFITTPNTNRGYKLPYINKEQLVSFLNSFNNTNLISAIKSCLEYSKNNKGRN